MNTGPLAQIEQEFKGDRADLIPVLQRIQAVYDYLPKEAIRKISRWLKISENEIYGVATFYAQFRFMLPCQGRGADAGGVETPPGNQSR